MELQGDGMLRVTTEGAAPARLGDKNLLDLAPSSRHGLALTPGAAEPRIRTRGGERSPLSSGPPLPRAQAPRGSRRPWARAGPRSVPKPYFCIQYRTVEGCLPARLPIASSDIPLAKHSSRNLLFMTESRQTGQTEPCEHAFAQLGANGMTSARRWRLVSCSRRASPSDFCGPAGGAGSGSAASCSSSRIFGALVRGGIRPWTRSR